MFFLGCLGALLVGLSLGLLGAGGSIITVPVIHYLFGIDALHATTYSFFIVGCTALIGAIKNIGTGFVKILPALLFAVPSLISVFITRIFIIPVIPEHISLNAGFTLTRDVLILVFFASIMCVAGISK